jgi:ABC-type branched-subunit amino acid transport system substrate-binding protein
MLALALLLAAALLGDPASAQDKTAGTDADRQDASQSAIRLGMSADFSASARALSIELYRGAMAYLLPLNNAGGVNGRRVVIKAYDDRYEPDLAIRNTLKLMDEDDVFALFSYVGTPTMNRTLPLLQMHHDKDFLLFFPFTGADTNRLPPYDQLSFNLRASYDQEMKGLIDHFVAVNRTRIAVFYQADAYGRAGWGSLREALDEHGLEIAGEATYRRGSPFDQSYDRQVAIMQRLQPDAVVCVGTYPACAGFVRDMRHRDVDDLVCRHCGHAQAAVRRRAGVEQRLHVTAGELPGRPELQRRFGPGGARVSRGDGSLPRCHHAAGLPALSAREDGGAAVCAAPLRLRQPRGLY